MRRVLGALLLTWACFRVFRLLAASPASAADLDHLASRWWPALLIIVAAAGGARTVSSMTMLRGPTILMLLGGFGLLITTGVLSAISAWGLAATLLLMVVGFMLLIPGRGSHESMLSDPYPSFRAFLFFRSFASTSSRLTHVRAATFLAGLRIDLREASTPRIKGQAWTEDDDGMGAVIDVTAFGGTVEVLVPATWRVVCTHAPFTRPVRCEVRNDRVSENYTGLLKVNALTAGGEVTIKC